MSSYIAKPETVERKWYVIDADGVVLGRLASQGALMLRGKHKPTLTPHVDTGEDGVDFGELRQGEGGRMDGLNIFGDLLRAD